MPLKQKAVSTHWEFMFARPIFETPDVADRAARMLLAELATSTAR